ncbi:flagellar brake protein [Megalodesulfovibrio paquesii]
MKPDREPSPPVAEEAISLTLPLGGEALVEITNTHRRFKTVFVGMDRGQFVLLKLPVTRQLLDVLLPRMDLTVRFLTDGGRIFGFKAQVAHLTVKPFPLLFLTYPKKVEVLKLRKHERTACYQPIVFYLKGEDHHGVVVNISAGGCRIVVEEGEVQTLLATAAGEEIIFQFRPFGSDDSVYLHGTVKTALMDHEKLSMGVAFHDLDPDLAAQIEKFVETMLIYQQA